MTQPIKHKPLHNLVAGSTAGVFAVCGSYPFDLVKTRLHFEVAKGGTKPTILQATKDIWREGFKIGLFGSRTLGGLAGFYRGIDQLIPESAFKLLLRFYSFKEVQRLYRVYIRGESGKLVTPLPFAANIICGATSGVIEATIVVQPFERGKVLRADFESPYRVYAMAFRQYGVLGGLKSIYTGFIPTLGRQVGNQAFSFSIFYGLKNWYLKRNPDKKDLNTQERLLFGFMGGTGGCSITMPLDIVKSIAQKQQGNNPKGFLTIAKHIFTTKGIRGFYIGLAPRIGRVGIDRALGFFAFEWIISFLSDKNTIDLEAES
eukprot:TRINITY_DN1297_c0_g1_i1.p1 TRINITY_DN1297_c0_g1~~TRINITY_DN1297_c0_g1_i1.p1  ORF type:complete len:317 (-),score=43.39 TRINITY_DN1297_c0_g1_i1:127-1077(-)